MIFAPGICRSFGACGKQVTFSKSSSFVGVRNLHVGNNVSLSSALILCTRAKLIIGDDVMFGPRVTVVTGPH